MPERTAVGGGGEGYEDLRQEVGHLLEWQRAAENQLLGLWC